MDRPMAQHPRLPFNSPLSRWANHSGCGTGSS
jgi:hypothetical protein